MAEKYNSKIVLSSGEVLMDLTQDTVVADKLLKGFTAHDAAGYPIVGTSGGGVQWYAPIN